MLQVKQNLKRRRMKICTLGIAQILQVCPNIYMAKEQDWTHLTPEDTSHT